MSYLRESIPETRVARKQVKAQKMKAVRRYLPNGMPESWLTGEVKYDYVPAKPRAPRLDLKRLIPHKELRNLYDTGVCAICGGMDKDRNLALDHCHTSGKLRGLLCMACNTGLGHFKDNPERMRKAADYIEKSRG